MNNCNCNKLNLINVCSLNDFPFIEQDFDSLTAYGIICQMAGEINKLILQVNKNTEDLSNININFDNINNAISNINQEIENLKADMTKLSTDINNQVDTKLENQYSRVVQLMSDYQTIFNNELKTLRSDLEEEIKNIELGNVIAYDPTTGEYSNVSLVIQNVYDALRNNAITVNEFEALNLTAEGFDNKEISAYNFDVNGKIFLQ
nr:MAG TPA: hypothetical protein [Bacteriophage sp.]